MLRVLSTMVTGPTTRGADEHEPTKRQFVALEPRALPSKIRRSADKLAKWPAAGALHSSLVMHHRLFIISGILLSPSLLHAQTPAAQPPPAYFAPAPPGRDGVVAPTEASSDRWYARPLAIEGHMGFGTPLGFAGAALDYSPSRWFGGGVGVGAGAAGPQAAAMARFRIPLAEGLGLGLGGGLSGGNYEWVEGGVFSVFIDNPSSRTWKPAYWANADLAIEGRLQGGFTIRGYLGRAALLNPSDGQCAADFASDLHHCQTFHPKDGLALGYAGLAMGYAFSR